MIITYLGHAGIFIETEDCKIICDPWQHENPAFFDSWYVYPDNTHLDWDYYINSADYLYVSHTHSDHIDKVFLNTLQKRNKNLKIILPDYSYSPLEQELKDIGFKDFILKEGSHKKTQFVTYVSENVDREREDSELLINDNKTTFLNVNDSTVLPDHKKDIINKFGKIDMMACQFSGASFYPNSYNYNSQKMAEICTKNRSRTINRFLSVHKDLEVKKTILIAGPPCFLDEDMIHLNFYDNNASIFPDGWQIKEFDEDDSIYRIMPGDKFSYDTVIDRKSGPNKKQFIEDNIKKSKYTIKISSEEYENSKVNFLQWINAVMRSSSWLKKFIPEKVYLSVDNYESFKFDFNKRIVKTEPINKEGRYYIINMPSRIFQELVLFQNEDWEYAFLSGRCRLERNPDRFNPHILGFFRNLSSNQLNIIRDSLDKEIKDSDFIENKGWKIPRLCPHLKYDLKYHSEIDHKNSTLTCLGHGWKWDLKTGKGINTVCKINCNKIENE